VRRLSVLALFLFGCLSLLLVQFYRIQIIQGEEWSKKAEGQHFFTVAEPCMRGRFLSNTAVKLGHPEKPQPLVYDIRKYHLFVDSLSVPAEHRDEAARTLMELLQLKDEQGRLAFRSQFDRKSRSRKLAAWLDPEMRDAILRWWLPYAKKRKIASNALFFVGDYKRSYPYGKLLGQLLHTIQELKDPKTGDVVPTGGLEYAFHRYLKGKEGRRRLMRSPRHTFETGEVIESAADGADIYLTINHSLQAICEEEVEKGVKCCGAKSGWAVMMDPMTGEILALAQYPFFNPAEYRRYFNDPELAEATKLRAVTDAHEPGSVAKAVTLATALLANRELQRHRKRPLFDPEEMMPSDDGNFPGRVRPIRDTHRHKFLNMDMAMQKSSNIYMARLMQRAVERLGNGWYRAVLQEVFGFGGRTGLEVPSESPGVLPKPGKMHPNGKLEWSVPTPFSLAMGHNFQANTIQIVRAFGVLANRGYLVRPTLVRKIVKRRGDGGEEILEDHTTEEWRSEFKHVLPYEIAERVVQSLKYVTKPGGSGWRADVWGYTEAGKTATARKIVEGKYSNKKYLASFVGFAPVNEPAFVLMVAMDEPDTGFRPGIGHMYYGSQSAAPVFSRIAKRSLEYLGIAPDDPFGFPVNDPRYDPERADWKFEMRKLQEKYDKWNK